MKKLFFCAMITFAIMFVGCAGKEFAIQYPNACDEVQGPSKLCELAKENGINLTALADGLGLANFIAIKKDLYTKEQAREVLMNLRDFMKNPVSYAAFKAELTDIVDTNPGLLQTVDTYVNQLVSTQIMYKDDRELILGRLDRLIAGLG